MKRTQEFYHDEILQNGRCFIPHHDSITGKTVAYFPYNQWPLVPKVLERR